MQDTVFKNGEFQHGDSRALGQVWALLSCPVAARAQAEAPGRPQQERAPLTHAQAAPDDQETVRWTDRRTP